MAVCGSVGEVERESFSHLEENTRYKAKRRQGWHLLPLKLSQTQFFSGLALQAGDFSAESAGQGQRAALSAMNSDNQDSWTVPSSLCLHRTCECSGLSSTKRHRKSAALPPASQQPGCSPVSWSPRKWNDSFQPSENLGKRCSTCTNEWHCHKGDKS